MTANQEPSTAAPTSTTNRGCLSLLTGAIIFTLFCGGLLFGVIKVFDYFGSQDEWADRPGIPVPSPLSSPPPDHGEGVEFGLGDLKESLESRVLSSAGVVKPTTSECDTTELRPTFTCKITYDGEVVTYTVEVDLKPAGEWSEYEAHTDSVIMTREGVLAAVWRMYGTHTHNLRCEDGIPEKARVAPGTKLPQRCYFVPTKDHPMFRHDDDLRTVQVEIIIGDGDIHVPINRQ